jgi:REP element-mobilizing transposase RayT
MVRRQVAQVQIEIDFSTGSWGGKRKGSGRKAGPPNGMKHEPRNDFPAAHPCHVTLKVLRGLPSLRKRKIVRAIEASFAEACERGSFRLLHYSIQRNHAHLIVEADDRFALAKGMKSIAARFARAVNRALGRSGRVLKERFHLHVLGTPREVRNALAYVLLNARKHGLGRAQGSQKGRVGLDPASSGRWFDGWRGSPDLATPERLHADPVVARARTWMLRVGWRIHGLLDPRAVPGAL